MTDTKKLRAIMVEKGFTQEKLASELKISPTSLNYKINNRREFKVSEINAMINALNITKEEMENIFFSHSVECNSTTV